MLLLQIGQLCQKCRKLTARRVASTRDSCDDMPVPIMFGQSSKAMLIEFRLKLMIVAVLCASGALAEPLKPAFGGDFNFRKLAPPTANSGKRINIQIEPDANPFPKRAPIEVITPEAPVSKHADWFWNNVSPDRSATSVGRFTTAINFLQSADETAAITPSLNNLQSIANAHGKTILLNTINTKLSPAMVLALIWVESAGKPAAKSNKGAQGLMQLIPATAERFGVADANDPQQNIKGGVTYLDWLLKEFNGDPLLALAGYNAGENAVKKHNGVPPYAETRNYVPKVLAAWMVARSLCLTPPDLVTDGCVFRTEG